MTCTPDVMQYVIHLLHFSATVSAMYHNPDFSVTYKRGLLYYMYVMSHPKYNVIRFMKLPITKLMCPNSVCTAQCMYAVFPIQM